MKNVMLVTRGHPFERESFFQMFEAIEQEGIQTTHVEQPAAQAFFNVELANAYDALVMYDMPGIHLRLSADEPRVTYYEPENSYKERLLELVEKGHGFVFLHHAIAGWPTWDEYSELIGGRFFYAPDTIRGVSYPDSGYRIGVEHTVNVVGHHPVTEGIPESFTLTDEVYLLSTVYEDSVEPLLTSNYEPVTENFWSSGRFVTDFKGDNIGWERPPGSNLVGWARTVGNSRVVYLQCGHDEAVYANTHYQRLIRNAIDWVSTREK